MQREKFSSHLDANVLMHKALRQAGRQRFSDTTFVEPLQRLLHAFNEEAALSSFGRRAARFDIMRCLTNLLRFDAEEEVNPAITARPIEAPVFITGLPRSSTTFLHALLAQDPQNAVPRCWELIYPYPWRFSVFQDWRRDWVEMQFRIFRLLSPGISQLHPLSADTPQECTDITAQVFQSLRFDTTYHIPSYQAWFDEYGHHAAFRFHRRFLQHLDVQNPGRRWVLKSPDNIFALDAILAAYPDAHIVFLHRDPLSVVASCVKLTELLRKPFTRSLDRKALGRDVASRLIESADRMASAAPSTPILHLYYREVIADPLKAVSAIYQHCGRDFTPEARQHMQVWLNQRSPHRRRRHYDLSEFGLDPNLLRERFAAYVEHFSVPREGYA